MTVAPGPQGVSEFLVPLPRAAFESVVRVALAEDLGEAGDITSAALVRPGRTAKAILRCREAGVAAGVEAARLAFRLTEPSLRITAHRRDGARLQEGDPLLEVLGDARAVLAAERTALNLAQRLSGIATGTHRIVEAIANTGARILCTRKTTPGLRALEKHAVRAGGGMNHRFGLHDGYLIKDNHIAALDGDIAAALSRAHMAAGPMRAIQIEVDTLDQLRTVLESDLPDAVLLDNMAVPMLREAVRMTRGRLILEASGGINPSNAVEIAKTGVDFLSSGWITHSAPALDLGLDFE